MPGVLLPSVVIDLDMDV